MKKTEKEFRQISEFIDKSRNAAVGFMNYAAVATYWAVGGYVAMRLRSEAWGSKTVVALGDYLKTRNPKLKGFGRRQIYNMVAFYETYSTREFDELYERLRLDEFVQTLPGQIVQLPTAQLTSDECSPSEDALPGRSEIVHFQNAQLDDSFSDLDLYLAAIDHEVKRPEENPTVGILLCPHADKCDVKYTLDRTMSPMMVAEYRRLLIPEEVLKRSLEEYCRFMKRDA